MHIQDFFQNFLKLFLVGLHGDCTINLIAQDMSPSEYVVVLRIRERRVEFSVLPFGFVQETKTGRKLWEASNR